MLQSELASTFDSCLACLSARSRACCVVSCSEETSNEAKNSRKRMQMSPIAFMFHTSPITRACARVALAESRAFARFSFNLVVSISFAFALTCAISLVVLLSPAISTGINARQRIQNSGTFGDARNEKPWNSMQERQKEFHHANTRPFPRPLAAWT